MDPDLQKLFSSAGIKLGQGQVNPSAGRSGPPMPNEAADEQQMDTEVPDNTDTDDEQLAGGSPESDIFRAIVEGTPYPQDGSKPIADFSFLPEEFRDQIREILQAAVSQGTGDADQSAGASVG